MSRLAVVPSLRPHCPPANATDPLLWLLDHAIRAGGLRHLLVPWTLMFAHRTRHMCHCMFYGMMWQSHAHDMMISPHAVLAPSPACMHTCKFDMHAHVCPNVLHCGAHWGFTYCVCRGMDQQLCGASGGVRCSFGPKEDAEDISGMYLGF